MTQQYPSESERKAFMDKLTAMRGTLNETEQRMLDGMVIASFTPEEPSDVQGYVWVPTPAGYVWQPNVVPPWYYTVPVYAPPAILPAYRVWYP